MSIDFSEDGVDEKIDCWLKFVRSANLIMSVGLEYKQLIFPLLETNAVELPSVKSP